jgi:hypothetical protein
MLNEQYAKLVHLDPKKAKFDTYFSGLDDIRRGKRELLRSLDQAPAKESFFGLERALRNCIASDLEFLAVSRQQLKLTLSSLANMQALLAGMSGDEESGPGKVDGAQRQRAMNRLAIMRDFFHYTLEEMKDLGSEEKVLRERSLRGIDNLNREAHRLGLPYKYARVFDESYQLPPDQQK